MMGASILVNVHPHFLFVPLFFVNGKMDMHLFFLGGNELRENYKDPGPSMRTTSISGMSAAKPVINK